jgi:5-methylthioadenosine/S-adenosylhomocysteine deaminase
MDAANTVIPDGGVLVDGGRIAAVGGRAELLAASAPPAGAACAVRPLPGRLLMPGLVNTHLHSGLLRGTAEQLPVWEWLRVHIDPMHRVLRPEEAEAASWLCYAESLLSGTTPGHSGSTTRSGRSSRERRPTSSPCAPTRRG